MFFFSFFYRKQGKTGKTPGPKRKFASVAISQSTVEVATEPSAENPSIEESVPVIPELSALPEVPIETASKTLTEQQKSDEQLENAIKSIQPAETLTIPTAISPAPPAIAMDMSEISMNETSNQTTPTTLLQTSIEMNDLTMPMDVTTTELTTTPISGNSTPNKMPGQLISPTTPSVPKERKRRIIIDDDDESPTFNPQRSTKKIRGKNRRKSLMLKKQQRKSQQLLSASIAATINAATDKPNETAIFTSPEAIVSVLIFLSVYKCNVCLYKFFCAQIRPCDRSVYAPRSTRTSVVYICISVCVKFIVQNDNKS